MHYSLTFYAPDISRTVDALINNDHPFLARKGQSPLDGHTYFTIIVQSPSGKAFEITSTNLDPQVLDPSAISTWERESECPECHFSARYKREELDAWYSNFSDGNLHTTARGLPAMMPIRNNIAVSSIATVARWLETNVPALATVQGSYSDGSARCRTLTTNMPAYTTPAFELETRFVENAAASSLEHSVADFVDYVAAVNANWTGVDWGWSAWYDRHLGLLFEDCSLDTYMTRFAEGDVSFHPHGQNGVTKSTGTPKDHCWTEGVEAYGLEMQGSFDYTYKTDYSVFEWCSWSTGS